MQVEVSTTKEVTPSLQKCELTRELGVAAALALLAARLHKTYNGTPRDIR
jgi:hypothetical protein